MKNRQQGFAFIEAIIILVILGFVGFAGYRVLNGNKKSSMPESKTSAEGGGNQPVAWSYDQKNAKYVSDATPPKCKNPYKFTYSPINLAQATSLMLPGQWRGFGYKPHGGFRFDNSADGSIEVKLPMDAKLVSMSRYLETDANEVQYLMTFESDCGIAVRFDHLYKLTAKFQAIADKLPPAQKDDSRTQPLQDQPYFKAGEEVATAVGHPYNKNFSVDFGVYDYRRRNDISKTNRAWAELHKDEASQTYFGVCWLDMLPGGDSAAANKLAKVVVNPNKPDIISDYCRIAPHTTMEYNGGQAPSGTYNAQ